MVNKRKKVALSAGGTAGHINPLLEVAKVLQEQDIELLYLGTSGIEKQLVGKAIKFQTILAGKLHRHISLATILNLAKLKIGIFQAIWHLKKFKPDVVFAKGGFVSLPVVLASKILRIPLVAHESDAEIGLSNKIALKFCQKICLGFPLENYTGINLAKAVFTGTPVNPLIHHTKVDYRYFGFDAKKQVIFITGGSQGAQTLNEKIAQILPELLENYQIIFQTGAHKPDYKAGKNDFWQKEFLDDAQMAKAYATADLIISRAGASTLAEISASGKPAILIPLPWSAQNHQVKNARIIEKAGAVVVLDQKNTSPEKIAITINNILDNKIKIKAMAQAVSQFYEPQSARKIANEISKLL